MSNARPSDFQSSKRAFDDLNVVVVQVHAGGGGEGGAGSQGCDVESQTGLRQGSFACRAADLKEPSAGASPVTSRSPS